MGSCRKSNIYSPRYEGVCLIGSEYNDFLQSGSDGKCLQRPHYKFMMANWRVLLQVHQHLTAHQSGATSI
jgi:hypothetical protein